MTSSDYDVVVVGARAAGASTAMLLARRGHRVLLLDRAPLPSDIARGHFIYRHGPRRLQNWGLLDAVIASGTPPVTTLTSDFGDFALVSDDLVIDDVPWGIGPRRMFFDKIVLDAAIAAGVNVQDATVVDDVIVEDGRVVGVRARSSRGGATTVRARLTVGADGAHSRIAQSVRAPMDERVASMTCWYFSYWADAPIDGIELQMKNRRAVFVFPTSDHLTAVFVAFPIGEFAEVRTDPEAHVLATLDLTPALGELIRGGHRVEPMYGTADVPNFIRTPAGPGWALVGDAACHKDPMLALGMCHALQDADILAECADKGLSGRQDLDDALRTYAVRRKAATADDFHENLQMARLEPPPPDMLALRSALSERPADSRLFAMAAFGMIPRETFFNPANLARIMAPVARAA